MEVKFIKLQKYMQTIDGVEKELQCFELTEEYAFMAPVIGDNGLDFTKVAVYSNREGTTPIESKFLYKK